jgi:predicted RNA-binding protein with RPS1 domain
MDQSQKQEGPEKRRLAEGESALAQVTALKSYGAFVRLEDGEAGLIHISEVAEGFVHDISQRLSVGQTVVVKVVGRNHEGKLNLSLKQVTKQDEAAARYRHETESVQRALEEQQPTHWLERRKQLNEARLRPQPVASSTESLSTWMKEARRVIGKLRDRVRGRERLHKRLYF